MSRKFRGDRNIRNTFSTNWTRIGDAFLYVTNGPWFWTFDFMQLFSPCSGFRWVCFIYDVVDLPMHHVVLLFKICVRCAKIHCTIWQVYQYLESLIFAYMSNVLIWHWVNTNIYFIPELCNMHGMAYSIPFIFLESIGNERDLFICIWS